MTMKHGYERTTRPRREYRVKYYNNYNSVEMVSIFAVDRRQANDMCARLMFMLGGTLISCRIKRISKKG